MWIGLIVAAGVLLSEPRVVDGDTLRDGRGEYYRVENLDAPELGRRARCPAELALAEAARDEARAAGGGRGPRGSDRDRSARSLRPQSCTH
jgi:endonuclease YncB( thermonuclease family)